MTDFNITGSFAAGTGETNITDSTSDEVVEVSVSGAFDTGAAADVTMTVSDNVDTMSLQTTFMYFADAASNPEPGVEPQVVVDAPGPHSNLRL